MSDLLPAIDHIGMGLSRVVTQYRGKPKFNTLLACYLEQIQHVEDALHDVVAAWRVDTAVGWRLTALCSLVGQPRVSDNDTVQRLFLKARIQVNLSSGKAGTLMAIADLLIPGWSYYELPQNVFFECYNPDLEMTLKYAEAVRSLLQAAAPTGVQVSFAWTNGVIGKTPSMFRFAATGAVEQDASYGFAPTNIITGITPGYLAAGL